MEWSPNVRSQYTKGWCDDNERFKQVMCTVLDDGFHFSLGRRMQPVGVTYQCWRNDAA